MSTASTVAAGVYPKAVKGAFRRAKDGIAILLLAVYFIGPWLRWDRGPGTTGQAVLLDLDAPRGHILWMEIWPQDIHYLAGLLILGTLVLFATASVAGRVWCGFTCPQTVFSDIFIRIERLCEGDRSARMRRDGQPWTAGKLARKTIKHAGWLIVSVLMAVTFTFYFVEAPDAVAQYLTLTAGPWMWTTVATLTVTTYVLGGLAREQMCNAMCPWPRIQSTMLDDHSLVVTYQAWRGDTRAPRRKSQTAEQRFALGLGDCIDCNQCVQVCPIGIDIRNGVNADCINCGLCIDACDSIMDGIGQPRKLIAFDSFANHAARRREEALPTRVLRPKTYILGGLMALGAVALALTFGARSTLEVAILQERAPLFVTLSDGSIRNAYTLKISNKERRERQFEIAVAGVPDLSLRLGDSDNGGALERITIPADAIAEYRMYVAVPRNVPGDAMRLTVREIGGGGADLSRPLSFFSP